ncbi:hypothetical protein [Polaromonas hydrogenivorans]|uniref:Uncharacterized protein n=1 Tax=Polaromonas hydrogenivorans TaxID=335476 RepID=A0AAU7LYV8_9BURK
MQAFKAAKNAYNSGQTVWSGLCALKPGRYYGSKLLENASKGQNYLHAAALKLALWAVFKQI